MVKILYNNKIVKKQYTNGNVINKIPFQVEQSTTIKSPEYISRTASANGYIGLGEYFTDDCVIEIDFQMTQAKGYCIIGDYMNNDNDDWRLFLNFDVQVNNKLNYDFLNDRKQWTTNGWNNRFHLEIGNYYVKNIDTGSVVINATRKTGFTRPNQMYLFHFDGYTGQQVNLDYGNVYFVKIWKGGLLVKDFIPYTDMNGNYGLYDKVSNTVFSSTGQMTGSSTINDVVIGSSSDTIYWQYADMGTPTPPEPIDYTKEYLTVVAETDNVSVSLVGGVNGNTFQYSTDDGSTWNNVSIGQTTPSINTGDKMMFKASNLNIGNETGIGTIRPSGSASVEGNIMSLLYGDNFVGQTSISNNFQLRKLFSGATNITSAENMVLPATAYTKQCYSQMFQGCTNLVTPPKVVGTATATFNGDYCLSDMFANCSSMTTAPELPMTTLGTQCYWYMMQGCTSLATAPLLAAPTINTQSYSGMFNGCTSLNSITCLATAGISTNNCANWATNVSSSGTFIKAANVNWPTGANGIPSNWTVQDAV